MRSAEPALLSMLSPPKLPLLGHFPPVEVTSSLEALLQVKSSSIETDSRSEAVEGVLGDSGEEGLTARHSQGTQPNQNAKR